MVANKVLLAESHLPGSLFFCWQNLIHQVRSFFSAGGILLIQYVAFFLPAESYPILFSPGKGFAPVLLPHILSYKIYLD
jgi:hypothetical protein